MLKAWEYSDNLKVKSLGVNKCVHESKELCQIDTQFMYNCLYNVGIVDTIKAMLT